MIKSSEIAGSDGWSLISFLQKLYRNTKGRFPEKIMTIDLKTKEIFNFSTLKKCSDDRSLSYKKCHKRQNVRQGQYTLTHYFENCNTKFKSQDLKKHN